MKRRVDNIIKQAMSNAGVNSPDLTLGLRYRGRYARTNKNLQRMDQVRKKLDFNKQEELLSEEGPSMSYIASTAESPTADINTEKDGTINDDKQHQNYSEALLDEIVGPTAAINTENNGTINDDQQHLNYSKALMDEIVGGSLDSSLEIIPADLFEKQNTVPVDDFSEVQLGIPDIELTNIDVDLSIPETSPASNSQKQTVKNTEDGLTTPEICTASNTVSAGSGGSKTIKSKRGAFMTLHRGLNVISDKLKPNITMPNISDI